MFHNIGNKLKVSIMMQTTMFVIRAMHSDRVDAMHV